MKRRVPEVEANGAGVPVELARFVAADWIDPTEVPPDYWDDRSSAGEWRTIRGFRRFLDARRKWEAETGKHIVRSWEQERDATQSAARTLDEFNEPYSPERFVESGEDDPRVLSGEGESR